MRCQSVKWLTAGLCRPPRTANFLVPLPSASGWQSFYCLCRPPYDVIYTSLHGRPLPSAADGKLFAVSHCRQTDQMGQLPGSTAGCHVSSLPSAADGKEAVAVGGRRQRACILGHFSVFLLNPAIFTENIYDIYRYILQGNYRANI